MQEHGGHATWPVRLACLAGAMANFYGTEDELEDLRGFAPPSFASVLDDPDVRAFLPGRLAQVVVTTRNYFVHLEAKDPITLEGRSLYEANQLLILALQCNLLLDLGLSPTEALPQVQRAYGSERFWRELLRRNRAGPKRAKPNLPSVSRTCRMPGQFRRARRTPGHGL